MFGACLFLTVSPLSQSPQQLSRAEHKLGKRAEKESGAKPLEPDDHRRDAETVKRGYSPGVRCRDDGADDPVRSPGTTEHTFACAI